MKARQIPLWLLTLLLIGQGIFIAASWRKLYRRQASAAAANARHHQWQLAEQQAARLRAQLETLTAQEKNRRLARPPESPLQQATEAQRQAQRDARQDRRELTARAWIAALDNPEFRQALELIDRDFNVHAMAPFLNRLSPDQASHMLDLVGQLMIATMDANQESAAQGFNNSERIALLLSTTQDLTSQIQQYLGPDNFAAWQQFNQQWPMTDTAQTLQGILRTTGAPLSDAEAQALADAMYQATPDAQRNPPRWYGALGVLNGANGQPPQLTQAQLTAAQSVLTPAEYQSLQQLASQWSAIRAAQRAMNHP